MPSQRSADGRAAALLAELRAAGELLSVRKLMKRARLHPGERAEVKSALRDLVREGELVREGKQYGLAQPASTARDGAPPSAGRRGRHAEAEAAAVPRAGAGRRGEVVGTLTRHRDGYGFVARLDRQGEDVFVPPGEAQKALDGDLVRLAIVPGRGGRTMGRIDEVVERRRRWLIGTYFPRGRSSFVVPAGDDLPGQVAVPPSGLAEEGEVVKVALRAGSGELLEGEVVERVGRPGDPRVEVLRVSYAKGFSDLFPEAVQAEAEGVPDHVLAEERRGRKDLTGLPLVTIDGEDARDFDDAVYVERLESGGRGKARGKARWRAIVAIADVAHYVRAGSALDAEALRRGTSVYFPAQVLPMLPERLSNGICSLNPGVERLCMVADLLLDEEGGNVGTTLYPGVMRSAARCTYTEVASALAGELAPERERFRGLFSELAAVQEKLTSMRARRGAIDFDIPETRVVLDAGGGVQGIERRPRNRAHRIVEELMLAANEAVARQFGGRELPTLYRVHGLPDEEKLDAFRKLARTHGFEVPEGALGPKELNRLLHAIEGHAQQRALNQLLLRAMMQALYTTENIGHYGLAAEHYLHFTSPIRRYPDLVVHRLLKEGWARGAEEQEKAGAPGGDRAAAGRRGRKAVAPASAEAKGAEAKGASTPRDLGPVAALCSERERAAMQAEREIGAYYAALFMKEKVGQLFEGVVASVVEFGLFVEIAPWYVEGLVKSESLGEGFELDPNLHALVQRRTGRAYRVGDRLRVKVAAASPARRQIDLDPAGEAEPARQPGVDAELPPAASRRGRISEVLAEREAPREAGKRQASRAAGARGTGERGPSARRSEPSPRRGGAGARKSGSKGSRGEPRRPKR